MFDRGFQGQVFAAVALGLLSPPQRLDFVLENEGGIIRGRAIDRTRLAGQRQKIVAQETSVQEGEAVSASHRLHPSLTPCVRASLLFFLPVIAFNKRFPRLRRPLRGEEMWANIECLFCNKCF